jgi:hypothetical protein
MKITIVYESLISDPEGFIVDDSYGPLRAGEIERGAAMGSPAGPRK